MKSVTLMTVALVLASSIARAGDEPVLRCIDPGWRDESGARSAAMVLDKPLGRSLYYIGYQPGPVLYLLEVFDGKNWKRAGGFCANETKVLESPADKPRLEFGIFPPPPTDRRWRLTFSYWWVPPGASPDYTHASKATYEHSPK